ncbi:J domain-containing protein [Erwinia sp. P6884]|uniref:J domain-containing protein n=1 Tax=Erwinia sp. P6884 TaxID=3141450 RepID=UPI003198F4F7
MNSWQILGIDPTSDEALIRRAYARQLKQHRPDSDPEGYQQLREAFELVKEMARYQHVGEEDEAEAVNTSEVVETPEAVEIALKNGGYLSGIKVTESHFDPAEFELSSSPLYTSEEVEEHVSGLLENAMQGLNALASFYQEVTHKGTLQQQQQFHQDVAAKLAEQPDLTEWLLEQVSDRLGWGLDQYSSSYLVPQHLQYALYQQIRATEREQAWKKVALEKTHGNLLNRTALKLLCSERNVCPFWVRLIPGLIAEMTQQRNKLYATFPELVERLNPAVLEFISKPQYALSWQGMFLLLFWGTVLHYVWPAPPQGPELGWIAGSLIIFYIYINDLILMSLKGRQWLMGLFLGVECLFSLLMLCGLFIGVLFILISSMPSKGEGFSGLVPLFLALIEWLVLWAIWPKNVPGLRRPGIAVARLLTSPWRLLATLDFTTMAFPLAAAYGAFCYLILNELMKLAAHFL